MAEEANVKPLMETLYTQQDLLQKLYTELDVEREASATAINESLSMILRLQGEKAAVEMESIQYKRIAEEKMFHAHESLETFRDLIYQKEMQIASLEFQVQAYKFKLVSLGCKDVGEIESSFPVNLLSRTSTLSGSGQGFIKRSVRRGCSLPPDFLKNGDEPPFVDRNGSAGSSLMALPEMETEDVTSYWQQIKRLDERVKELSISKDLIDCGDSAVPSTVNDIFEVPEASNPDEFGDLDRIEENGELGSVKNNWNQREAVSSDVVNDVISKPLDLLVAEQLQFKRPDVTDFELQQLNRRLKRIEDERIMATQEIEIQEDDEKFMLLKAIKDQLNFIEDEIMSRKTNKPPPAEHVDLTPLSVAMLHCWL